MQVRLCPGLGGDGTMHGINIINDTGSTLLTTILRGIFISRELSVISRLAGKY